MPIQFRCPECRKLLGVATRKAGVCIECPKCHVGVTVPAESTVSVKSGAINSVFDEMDVDELLANGPKSDRKVTVRAEAGSVATVQEPPQRAVAKAKPEKRFRPEDRFVKGNNPFADPLEEAEPKELPRLEVAEEPETKKTVEPESDPSIDVEPLNDPFPRTFKKPSVKAGPSFRRPEVSTPTFTGGKIAVLGLLLLCMVTAAFVAGYWLGGRSL